MSTYVGTLGDGVFEARGGWLAALEQVRGQFLEQVWFACFSSQCLPLVQLPVGLQPPVQRELATLPVPKILQLLPFRCVVLVRLPQHGPHVLQLSVSPPRAPAAHLGRFEREDDAAPPMECVEVDRPGALFAAERAAGRLRALARSAFIMDGKGRWTLVYYLLYIGALLK